jgi:ElaB/YqjD/DUF883 family membrane-anchored ribosome-binding protein
MEGTVGTRPDTDTGTQDKAGQAKEQVQEKTQQVAERAQEGAGQAREKVREQVDQRSTQAGQQVQSAAGDARSLAEQLRGQGKDAPARYAEQAADRAERLGGYLERADGDEILHDVEDFARRNPWAVVAGGVALGFTLSRMLKASSSERYRQSAGQRAQLSSPRTGIGNGSGTPVPGVSEGLAQARYDR